MPNCKPNPLPGWEVVYRATSDVYVSSSIIIHSHARHPRSLPGVRIMTLGAWLMPVAVGLGVVGHVAIRLRMAGMDRLPMAHGAASGVQTVHR